MKKVFAFFLSLCILSATALAADAAPGAPSRWMFDSDEAYQTALTAWEAEQPEEAPAPAQTEESTGAKYGVSTPLSQNSDDSYPVGSYVDVAGNVWSAGGALLSPDTAPASPPDEGSPLPITVPDDTGGALAPSQADALTQTTEDKPVWYVEDLRPTDPPAEVLDGLKALVTSIFGEYTPITTTTVVTESVGDETHQYLVETVAPGAAGVDYEWLAGVFLFGILLFCLMKLLGGVIS